uniref:Uncharacterized protein n=1 Tax=viral metagenome TaxID=1070528 RepID=A0A6C0J849_9ZZZZ
MTKLGLVSNSIMVINPSLLFVHLTVLQFIENFTDEQDFLWDRQRPVNNERVEEIREHLDDKPEASKTCNQIVTFGLVNNKDPYY